MKKSADTMGRTHDLQRRSSKLLPALLIVYAMSLISACGDKQTAESLPAEESGQSIESIKKTAQPIAPVKPQLTPDELFWNALKSVCGKKYGGQLTIGTEESDRDIGYAELTMNAKRCTNTEIDIGFSVDADDSRTWMIRRTEDELSLHHQHLLENGQADATSGYGGYTATEGTALRQEFPADEQTGQLIPAAATNVWALEIAPNKMFAYELQRVEEQRMFRVVFDLSSPLN